MKRYGLHMCTGTISAVQGMPPFKFKRALNARNRIIITVPLIGALPNVSLSRYFRLAIYIYIYVSLEREKK